MKRQVKGYLVFSHATTQPAKNASQKSFRIPIFLCPKCRKKHRAQNGAKTFGENPYIIAILEAFEQQKKDEFGLCAHHQRELCIFCKDESCMKAICHVCLLKDHMGHNAVDRIEEHGKNLQAFIKSVTEERQLEEMKLLKNRQNLKVVEKTKRECMSEFDKLTGDLENIIDISEEVIQVMNDEIQWGLEQKTNLEKSGKATKKDLEALNSFVLLDLGQISSFLTHFIS